jgi:hypothetical protein
MSTIRPRLRARAIESVAVLVLIGLPSVVEGLCLVKSLPKGQISLSWPNFGCSVRPACLFSGRGLRENSGDFTLYCRAQARPLAGGFVSAHVG